MGDDITIGVTEIVNNIEVTAQPNDQIVDISVIDNADDVTLNITPTVIEINVNRGSSFAKWGTILGTLSDQTDLQNALDLKANLVGGKVPASELPSYVDDVVEVANYAALPATGETGKIYVTLDNNKIYRWSGSVYIEIAANSAIWGAITGTLSSQTDLQNALNAKFDDPTGDTTQYIAGDGSLITFPVAGQAGTLVRQVRNTSGATLLKGTVVYINGANGNKPTIAKALATGDSTSAQTFGMLQADIANNANGYVVCVGDIIGLDTSAITEGTQLYLSSTTAGAYTSTKQVAPAHLVYIGVVTRSHPTQGQIEVKIQNGYELDEIHDVSITSKTNKDFLVYESATSLWKNKSLGTVLAGTSSQFVKGDGSLDSNTYALDSAVVHLTGAETITGEKSFNNATSSSSIFVTNSSTGNGISSFNTSTGNGLYLNNNSTGKGAYINNISSGIGLFVNNTTAATGLPFVIAKSNSNVFTINDAGEATGTKFVKSGGTSSQFLKADGSVDTNSYILSVAANAPLGSTGGTSPVISITQATTSSNGYLSSTDWNKFNNNIPSGTPNVGDYVIYNGSNLSYRTILTTSPLSFNVSTGTFAISQATTSANGYLSSTDWNTFNGKQNALTNPITGTGTTNYLPKFTGSTALGNSQIFDDGSFVGIGVASGLNRTLQIVGTQISQKEAFSPNEFLIGQFDSAGNAAINNVANANLYFHTNNQRAMTILANLNVGIGVNTPAVNLHIKGSGSYSGIRVDNTGTTGGGYVALYQNGSQIGLFGVSGAVIGSTASDFAIFSETGKNIDFMTDGTTTPKMRINTSGNVGIGTTSPNQLLHIEKDQNTYTNLRVRNNNAGSSAYTMIGLNSSGNSWGMRMGSSAANSNRLDFVIDAFGSPVERMSITSGGNVGIGTTSPSYILDVNGIGRFSSYLDVNYQASAANGSLNIDSADPTIRFRVSGGTANKRIYEFRAIAAGGTNDRLELRTWNDAQNVASSLLSVTNSGNVGIGTTSPQGKLHIGTTISNNATYNGQLILKSGTSTFGPQEVGGLEIVQADVNAGYGMKLYTNSSSDQCGIATRHNSATWTERLSISTITGNVGIGTISPSALLNVVGASDMSGTFETTGTNNAASLILKSGNGTTSGLYSYLRFINNNTNQQDWRIGTYGNNDFSFVNIKAGTTPFVINTSGNVCIGTTSPISSGTNTSTGATFANAYNWLAVTDSNYIQRSNNTNGGFFNFVKGSTDVGSITVSGTTTLYNVTSDYRLKEDFKNYSGLNLISKIKTYDYKWKSSEDRMYGVKAHELQEVLPYAVTGEKDAKEMQSVDYSKLVPILIQAIQELKAEIEILKNK